MLDPRDPANFDAFASIARGDAPATQRNYEGGALEAAGYVHSTGWPCRRCKSERLMEKCINDDHDDYRFQCLDCGHTWVEEGSDA